MQRMQDVFNNLAAQRRGEIMQLRRERNQAALQSLQEELAAQAEAQVKRGGPILSDEQKKAYSTVGGTPHLDGQYTVFGEVTDGLEVVEKIQGVKTSRADRPAEDVVVLSMAIVD